MKSFSLKLSSRLLFTAACALAGPSVMAQAAGAMTKLMNSDWKNFHTVEQPSHQGLRHPIAGIKVDRAEHGFQRVGQDGRAPLPAGAHFALAQAQRLGQPQTQRQAMKRVLLDEIGSHPGQVTFRQRAQAFVEQVGNGQVKHRIAQELQPLVVIGRETAMGERLDKQLRIGKLVLQPLLQCQQDRRQAHRERPRYFSTR